MVIVIASVEGGERGRGQDKRKKERKWAGRLRESVGCEPKPLSASMSTGYTMGKQPDPTPTAAWRRTWP
jgi:hypothetical protein